MKLESEISDMKLFDPVDIGSVPLKDGRLLPTFILPEIWILGENMKLPLLVVSGANNFKKILDPYVTKSVYIQVK